MSKAGEDLIFTGAWFLLFGTVTSAVGVSCKHLVSMDFGRRLFAKGNAIEAFGNSLQAVGREKSYSVEKKENILKIMIGSWIQAAGNSTNTFATNLEIQGLEEEGHKLNAVGSVIQTIGASLEALGASEETGYYAKFEVYGNELIGLGALIDGIGNVALLNDKDILGEQLLMFGSWIQVIGSISIIYALSHIIREEEENHKNEYQYGQFSH